MLQLVVTMDSVDIMAGTIGILLLTTNSSGLEEHLLLPEPNESPPTGTVHPFSFNQLTAGNIVSTMHHSHNA